METLIRHHILWHLIWVCIVCLCTPFRVSQKQWVKPLTVYHCALFPLFLLTCNLPELVHSVQVDSNILLNMVQLVPHYRYPGSTSHLGILYSLINHPVRCHSGNILWGKPQVQNFSPDNSVPWDKYFLWCYLLALGLNWPKYSSSLKKHKNKHYFNKSM